MKQSERVKAIKAVYRGYDRFLDSKVNNPDKYGVQLLPDAEKLICPCEAVEAPTKPFRKLQGQITVRMTKRLKGLLQQASKAKGQTVQTFVLELIKKEVEKMFDFSASNKYKKAIFEIVRILEENGVPFNIKELYNGWQLRFPWCDGDVICHSGSFDCEKGLTESYHFPWDNGDVCVFPPREMANKIIDYYKKEVEKHEL